MTNSPQPKKSVTPFEQELGIKPLTSRLALLKLVEQGFEYRIIPFTKQRLGRQNTQNTDTHNYNALISNTKFSLSLGRLQDASISFL